METIVEFMRTVALATMVPGLGGPRLAAAIRMGAELVETTEEFRDSLKGITAMIQTAVDEGRDLTIDEVQSLKSRSDAAHDRIQNG